MKSLFKLPSYIILLLLSAELVAQDDQQNVELDSSYYDQIFNIVDQMPEYPGGRQAFLSFFQKNINYPKSAIKNNVEGIVRVTFVVKKDGTLSDFSILKGVRDDLDNEALRVVKLMPRWVPGKKDNKEVNVSYVMPISFKLPPDHEISNNRNKK